MRIVSVRPGSGVREKEQESEICGFAIKSVQTVALIYPGTGTIASVILGAGPVNEKCLACLSGWGKVVTRRLVRLGSIVALVVALAVIFYETRPASRPVPVSPLPERAVGRLAVEKALGRWRDSAESEAKGPQSEQVVFVDQQRKPGQRLRAFALLGDFEVESCRCFKVRLELTEPEESKLVVYYVFGRDPMWVYRAEDFERIMHWEMEMPNTPAGAADSEKEAKSNPGRSD